MGQVDGALGVCFQCALGKTKSGCLRRLPLENADVPFTPRPKFNQGGYGLGKNPAAIGLQLVDVN